MLCLLVFIQIMTICLNAIIEFQGLYKSELSVKAVG